MNADWLWLLPALLFIGAIGFAFGHYLGRMK